jgi:exodeoxyribonuclease III
VKLATWNVNSLKVRLPRVLEFLAEHEPDVLCMQETKCEAAAFPAAELERAGYRAVHHSAGRWAGVAIAARGEAPPAEPVAGLRVASVYVPNGRAVGSPTFAEKLGFLDAAAERVAALRGSGGPLVLAGDFNVARDDLDVYDPAAFVGSTHVTPDERSRIDAILAAGGLVDALRHLRPDEVQYTWWDYRQGHFHRRMGLRIDLVLLSEALAPVLREVRIARDYRKGSKPSDHAPLLVELA